MKARNYRRTEGMPYTREEYIHGAPEPRISKYTMGTYREDYTHELELIALEELQVRDVALESARVTIGKMLSAKLGENYFLELKAHPHIVLR
ncbi:MAG: 50S ribosomal protein L16, partial [Nitrososphaerota archaeon]